MTLSEFYTELERHDWFHHMSDDHRVWSAGEVESARMKRISEESPEHKKLFEDFGAHHFSGEAFGKPKSPKPERPK